MGPKTKERLKSVASALSAFSAAVGLIFAVDALYDPSSHENSTPENTATAPTEVAIQPEDSTMRVSTVTAAPQTPQLQP